VRLADLPPPARGWEPLWVPALFAVSIGPVFFLVSAQAPLMQRWFAADPAAGNPYALYAASNLGSFAGLICYPLLVEPLLPLKAQGWGWSAGYALLIALVAACAAVRQGTAGAPGVAVPVGDPIPARRVALWLALAAVPSGLMLSTTTFLTTDIFAMPLLWVIPLGLYLLSFSIAFAESRALAGAILRAAPLVVVLAGGMAVSSRSSGTMAQAGAAVALLFVVAVALHARLYALRPAPERLTFFYLVMSAGGALGGVFCALIAPLVFDWVWEHPLLVLAAAALLPRVPLLDWSGIEDIPPRVRQGGVLVVVIAAFALGWSMSGLDPRRDALLVLMAALAIAACGVIVFARRWAFVLVLLAMMLGRGRGNARPQPFGQPHAQLFRHLHDHRKRAPARTLSHPRHHAARHAIYRRRAPAAPDVVRSDLGRRAGADRGRRSGARGRGRAGDGDARLLQAAGAALDVLRDRSGGGGAVAAAAPLHLPRFLRARCRDRIGDARLELAKTPPGSFDVLVVDAFSSDSIPLHLLTREALAVYGRVLAPDGVLILHISNRYLDLRPVVAGIARAQGWTAWLRDDSGRHSDGFTPSYWVALAPDRARLERLAARRPDLPWTPLHAPPGDEPWQDDYASILPHIRWDNLLGV
jgi:SAM-dependent methyltransferase